MRSLLSFVPILLLLFSPVFAAYNLVDEYSGNKFFSKWDFGNNVGWDQENGGAVNWLTQSAANTSRLISVNDKGNAVIKVDDTTNLPIAAPGDYEHQLKRNSVLLSSQTFYPVGSVIVFDAVHVPAGCSVWPAFWTRGANWPHGGEIDIIESVNLMTTNRITLHADSGCTKQSDVQQRGTTVGTNCAEGTNSVIGCTVEDTAGSFGQGLNEAGGGVWATQFDASGINVWFWNRKDVPDDVKNAKDSIDPSTEKWGNPAGAWPSSSCDIGKYFKPQQLVIDITLCGNFAGDAATYGKSGCGTTPPAKVDANTCYTDNVEGAGSNYAEAYFEISSIKVFSLSNGGSTVSNTTTSVSPATGSGTESTQTGSPTGSGAGNSAPSANVVSALSVTALVAAAHLVAALT